VADSSSPQTGVDRAHRLIRAHNAPDLLYGAVVAASVLAVSSVHVEVDAHVALAAGIVTVIYWLTHVYVEAIGNRFADGHSSMWRRVVEAMQDSAEVLMGALPPIAIFTLARLVTHDVERAAEIALWSTVVLLVVAGGGAAFLAGVRGWKLVAEAAVAGCFGVLVILLKYLLH
jgi:hypothetical protein